MKVELDDNDFEYLKSLPPAERQEAEEDLRFYKQEKLELKKEELDKAQLIINAISYFFNTLNKDKMFIAKTIPVASIYDYEEIELDKSLTALLNNRISLDDLKCDDKFKRMFNKFIKRQTVRIFTCYVSDEIHLNINLMKLL